jgi:sulfite exporter TauE/SafE
MLASSTLWAAFFMGLVGGPHCLLMCGGACAALCQSTPQQSALQRALGFQVGRVLGYGILGALGAASMQTIGELSVKLVMLQPLWNFIHVFGLFIGLYLLIFAFQPLWLDQGARRIWRWIQTHLGLATLMSWRTGPIVAGTLWALLPCGLLYSALMLAALTASPLMGWLSMMSFALGSGMSLWIAQWGFKHFQKSHAVDTHSLEFVAPGQSLEVMNSSNHSLHEKLSRIGFRVCGLALFVFCAWTLYNDTILQNAPWCVPAA